MSQKSNKQPFNGNDLSFIAVPNRNQQFSYYKSLGNFRPDLRVYRKDNLNSANDHISEEGHYLIQTFVYFNLLCIGAVMMNNGSIILQRIRRQGSEFTRSAGSS